MAFSRPRFDIANIVRQHRRALEARQPLNRLQRRVLTAIGLCRTAALGGHVEVCEQGDFERFVYHSCRNRHCMKCQALAQEHWIAARSERLLDLGHFHLVFTLPAELRFLAKWYPAEVYGAMFHAVTDTLLALGRTRLKATLGLTLVLHTWTRELGFHPHLHVLATAGGLALDGSGFVHSRKDFLFPVAMLGVVFPFHSRVQCYHAGLSRRNRDQAEFVFRRGKARIMVATIAFGMGIDKDDVRFVAHCGPPTAIGDYVQEVGRAGRDGSEAECLLLHSTQDWKIWRKRFQADEGAASKVSKRHQRPLSSGQEKARARNLKRHLDELERFEALVDGACLHQAIAKHYDEDIDPCEQHCCKCQNPTDHRKAWHAKHAAQVEPPREAMRLSQEEDWEPVPASELLDEAASDPTYGVALFEPDPEWPFPGLSPDPMDEMAPLDPTEAVEEFLKSAHGHPQVE